MRDKNGEVSIALGLLMFGAVVITIIYAVGGIREVDSRCELAGGKEVRTGRYGTDVICLRPDAIIDVDSAK